MKHMNMIIIIRGVSILYKTTKWIMLEAYIYFNIIMLTLQATEAASLEIVKNWKGTEKEISFFFLRVSNSIQIETDGWK